MEQLQKYTLQNILHVLDNLTDRLLAIEAELTNLSAANVKFDKRINANLVAVEELATELKSVSCKMSSTDTSDDYEWVYDVRIRENTTTQSTLLGIFTTVDRAWEFGCDYFMLQIGNFPKANYVQDWEQRQWHMDTKTMSVIPRKYRPPTD